MGGRQGARGEMLKRSVVFIHRWLGVALCLLFLLWFSSGIAMMYCEFPTLSRDDQLSRSAPLEAAAVALSPLDAFRTLRSDERPSEVRLNTFDGRPAYRFHLGADDTLVYADTGEQQGVASPELMRRVAGRWTGQHTDAVTIEPVREVDQWTVQGPLRTLRPLWKFSWPDGEQVYVAQRSGEVVQYTTTASRIGAYLGPIPHWLYFTPLRQHQSQWTAVVVWTSGAATIAALLGLAVGVWMYSPAKRYQFDGKATSVPYRGQKRLHMTLGLIFGVGAVTWAFSGLLSMDPFPAASGSPASDSARASVEAALRRPIDLAAFSAKSPAAALTELAGFEVKELELISFAGQPTYLATLTDGDSRIVPIDGPPRVSVDRLRLVEAITASVPARARATVRDLDHYDAYYLDRRHRRPLPVALVQLDDRARTRFYIDPKSLRIVGTYNSTKWTSRWLYHALHSLDFPWLYDHRLLWNILMVTFMAGGTALSVTSVILAWRVVRPRAFQGTSRPPAAGHTAM